MRRTARMIGWLASVSGLLGCHGPALRPLIFPATAQLGPPGEPGDTIVMVIDSNYIPFWDFVHESYTYHRGNVDVFIAPPYPGDAWTKFIEPRGVLELQASHTSYRDEIQPGAWFSVVVFDLPSIDDLPGIPTPSAGSPVEARIDIFVDGVRSSRTSELQLVGANGAPNPIAEPFYFGALLEELGPQRMVRLRPKHENSSQEGFPDDIGTIAGVEFDLVSDANCADQTPSAFPASEAARATALVGPGAPAGPGLTRNRVVLIDPRGFNLTFHGANTELAAQGPIVELVFEPTELPAGCDFNEGAVQIEALLVTGLDGEVLLAPPGDSTHYFQAYFLTPPSLP